MVGFLRESPPASRGAEWAVLPMSIPIAGEPIEFRLMAPRDRGEVLAFGRRLHWEDLLFLRRDITSSDEVDGWLREIADGSLSTVLAVDLDGVIVGYAAIDRGEVRWTRHVAEIRLLVEPRQGATALRAALLHVAFERALAADVEKIVAQVTPHQEPLRALFVALGFEHEATLRKHVVDARGAKHDVLVLSFDPERHGLQPCHGCAKRLVTLLALERRQLCWSCYELRYRELGGSG